MDIRYNFADPQLWIYGHENLYFSSSFLDAEFSFYLIMQ